MAYKESDRVTLARKKWEELASPASYTSDWTDKRDEALEKLNNRESFSYSPDSDALYRQYKDNYVNQGKRAMADTMGQAAALTGGYGNSYAVTAGEQAYQNYLSQLNDAMPELYQLALDSYLREGEALESSYERLADLEKEDYSRYRDSVDDYTSERDYLASIYQDERDTDYDRYADDRDFAYQQSRDAEEDRQWQAEFDYQVQQDALAAAGSGSSGGSSGSRSSGKSSSSKSSSSSATAPSLTDTLQALKNSQDSASRRQARITNTIQEALTRGEITKSQAATLKSKYSVVSSGGGR